LLDLDGTTLFITHAGEYWVDFGVDIIGSVVMAVLKVGIASYEAMKARTMAIARGEYKPARGEPKVWFTSFESIAKVLSAGNRELLGVIVARRPGSIQELAAMTGREKSNLSRTLKTLERYGIVQLKKGEGVAVPEVVERLTRRADLRKS
jgi:predicted transcriptional regulator